MIDWADRQVHHTDWTDVIRVLRTLDWPDKVPEKAPAEAFESADPRKVTRLHHGHNPPPEQSWVRGDGWSLAYC